MTGRTRLLLVLLGIAVVVALGYWKLRDRTGEAPPAGTAGTGSSAVARPGGSRPARPPIDPRSGSAPTGAAAGSDDVDDGDGDPSTRTYVLDNGAVVRDHRGAGMPPPMNPPGLPPNKRTMSTELTAKIYQQLAPVVAACGAAVPAGDRGGDPFVYVTMTVKVAEGHLTATDVYPTIHDVNGASTAAFPSCVAEKAKAITVASGDEPDHDDYIVQYPIRLR